MSERWKNLLFKDFTYYTEKYLLSSFMLYYALKNMLLMTREINILFGNDFGQGNLGGLPQAIVYYPAIKHAILFMFNAFNGGLLLCSRRPQQAPQDWRAIVIPLLSSYAMLAYNLTNYMPAWMTVNYIPPSLLLVTIIISCLLSLSGQIISLLAVFYLRRSFAVFIQLRAVIAAGPYKYVRHPMYTGYTVLTCGILLSNACVAYALIAALYVGLLAYRARLEENMLAVNNATYRKNMERTGFLFPRMSAFTAS